MLCTKYLVKILLISFNVKKMELLKASEVYSKKQEKSFQILTNTDVRVDQNLMKRFNETLSKTVEG